MKKSFAFLLAAFMLCRSLTGCANASQTYSDYVQAVLDCTYHADTAAYIALTGASEADAQALYDSEVRHTAALLCQQFDIETEYLTDETFSGFSDYAETLLEQVQYTVAPAVRSENAYHVSLTAEPLDFFEPMLIYIENAYIAEFLPRFATLRESDKAGYAKTMEDWGAKVLDVMERHTDLISHKDAVYSSITIQADLSGHYTISDQKWQVVDNLLLGVKT